MSRKLFYSESMHDKLQKKAIMSTDYQDILKVCYKLGNKTQLDIINMPNKEFIEYQENITKLFKLKEFLGSYNINQLKNFDRYKNFTISKRKFTIFKKVITRINKDVRYFGIAELEVPEGAIVYRGENSKLRVNEVIVKSIKEFPDADTSNSYWLCDMSNQNRYSIRSIGAFKSAKCKDVDKAYSIHDEKFTYKVGQHIILKGEKYNLTPDQCSSGIHGYKSLTKALKY